MVVGLLIWKNCIGKYTCLSQIDTSKLDRLFLSISMMPEKQAVIINVNKTDKMGRKILFHYK